MRQFERISKQVKVKEDQDINISGRERKRNQTQEKKEWTQCGKKKIRKLSHRC